MSGWDAMCDEELWLDYLEGELSQTMEGDMRLLLARSRSDRALVEHLAKTRLIIEKSDAVTLPEDGRYYSDMTKKIMARLDRSLDDQAWKKSAAKGLDPAAAAANTKVAAKAAKAAQPRAAEAAMRRAAK